MNASSRKNLKDLQATLDAFFISARIYADFEYLVASERGMLYGSSLRDF